MNNLSMYDNIEVGDTIEFPNSCLLVKSGVVSGFKGINGHAKYVLCDNGAKFPISRYKVDYTLEVK